ncbi:hypothetical protein [Crateriforma conspicua]|uniref:Uncharacterized protein n=1 Tax=Crateriforma conspicua TaxID=2527996 RepID=A0A5C6FMY1_9PLAN|nr:hypothetical protein [Crateriforma conspicua]TWU62512.1 hypothetical protein V7x_42470 [Crateriforma conspicua]
MALNDDLYLGEFIGKSRKYNYVHATQHLSQWIQLYDAGTLADVYQIACEAAELLAASDHHPAVRLAVNNTIAMAVTKKRSWEIPSDSGDLFRAYNAGIRRLAVFEPSQIDMASAGERSIGWQIMATLAKITATKERQELLNRIVTGKLSHAKLLDLVKSRKPKLKRPPIPGNVLKVAHRALAESKEQLETIVDPKFDERLRHVVNRDEFAASLECVQKLLWEMQPLMLYAIDKIDWMRAEVAGNPPFDNQ